MAQDQVLLELFRVVSVDAHVGEFSKPGCHAIDGLAGSNPLLDETPGAQDLLLCGGGYLDAVSEARSAPNVRN